MNKDLGDKNVEAVVIGDTEIRVGADTSNGVVREIRVKRNEDDTLDVYAECDMGGTIWVAHMTWSGEYLIQWNKRP